jgi:hypothetical protein
MSNNAAWSGTAWPTAELDRITRLHVLAAGLRGVAVRETVLEAPFERAWSAITDFERSVPAADDDVRRVRIVARAGDPATGEQLRFYTRQTARLLWIPAVIDVTLWPGWCWMVTRPHAYVVGMAAEPDGEQTRFAVLEGLAFPAPRWLRRPLQPLLAASRWRHRRHVPRDLAGFARFVEDELGD